VVGQANPPVSVEQSGELEEAERLSQQVIQLRAQGQYTAAIPLAERTLALREKVLGKEHLLVATSLNRLGLLYEHMGNYSQAEPLLQRSLAIREKVLGKEHPDVAQSLNNLAELYRDMGNYSQAEPLYQRSLAILEKVPGKEYPYAISLNNLALLYQAMGNYSQAELLFQRSLAIREKVLGKEHLAVATSLNNLALLYRDMGNYSQAETLLQRSLAIREKLLGKEHPDVANSLNNLAGLYQDIGNYSQAEPLLQRSLAIREKVLGKEHPDVAQSLNNLAELYRNMGNYSKAERLFQQALAIQEKVLGKEHPSVANTLNNLALLYQAMGNYSQADPLFQQALVIREKVLGKDHPDVANSLNNLALLYRDMGNYHQAEPLFQQALTIREKVLGKDHPDVANSLNSLAVLYQDMGNYSQAEPLLQRSLAIQEKVLGTEHPDVANSLNNLAGLYQDIGNYSQAEPLYQRSLAIREKVLGTEHPDVANSLNNLASLYKDMGNYSQAEPLYQRSLAIREKVLGTEHPDVANSLNNLASLYKDMGNYSQAETLYQRSLAIWEKALGKEHPDVANSLNNLASLYWTRGEIAPALEFQTRGINIEERNLALTLSVGSERQKQDYMATLRGMTDATISLHIKSAPNNPQATRLAFTTILRRKGRILDAVTDNLLSLRQNLTSEDQTLLDQLAATRSQLATLLFKRPKNLPLDQHRNQVATLKAQSDELEATLARRSTQFRSAFQPVTIETVQQLIPVDAALVELVSYKPFNPKATKPAEKWGTPRYVAYVGHHSGEPKWVDLGEAEPINQAVEDFRQALNSDASDVKPVARALDAKLMQPIRKLLGNTRNVLLSPDSQLNLIPFAALVDENNRYLVENYSINYLSSGRDLLRLQNHALSRSEAVIVANPDYNKPGDPASVAIIRRGSSSQIAAAQPINLSTNPDPTRGVLDSDRAKNITFDSLDNTEKEANAIKPILPGATLLTGSQATENVIKQLQAPKILHIATHGFFFQDVPEVAPPDFSGTILSGTRNATPNVRPTENPLLRSGLALAGANPRQSGSEDGILTALEAAGLNLSGTKLLVLSACKTGLGDVTNGEGVYGLRRAFAIAGAESQLMSLWAVNDYKTNKLMVDYYQRLKNNVGRSEALRQTQLEMLQNPSSEHPYYWAAFIPSGDWTAMASQ
jgi:CHAT domain-containing protein/F0F1-type ATP synthase beta subunit